MNLLTCVHSQGMFHHRTIFVLHTHCTRAGYQSGVITHDDFCKFNCNAVLQEFSCEGEFFWDHLELLTKSNILKDAKVYAGREVENVKFGSMYDILIGMNIQTSQVQVMSGSLSSWHNLCCQ